MAFVAVYDANVLYPAWLRDLLVRLGQTGIFQAKWTNEILDEMTAAIARTHPEFTDRLQRTRQLMNQAIPDVLAAAIRCNAQVIVTANLTDFPLDRLDPYGIEAQHPDEFVLHLLDLHSPVWLAFSKTRLGRSPTRRLPSTNCSNGSSRLVCPGVATIRRHLGS